jgi:hypothetical protein
MVYTCMYTNQETCSLLILQKQESIYIFIDKFAIFPMISTSDIVSINLSDPDTDKYQSV